MCNLIINFPIPQIFFFVFQKIMIDAKKMEIIMRNNNIEDKMGVLKHVFIIFFYTVYKIYTPE